MARTVYVTTTLTGGGSALDGVNGNSIVKGDMDFNIQKPSTVAGRESGSVRVYTATTEAASESSPDVVVPDSNPGSWNWKLLSAARAHFDTTGKEATLPNYGVHTIRTTAPTVHVMRRPNKGTQKRIMIASTHVIKIRLTTAVAASLAVPTVRIGSSYATSTKLCVIVNSSRSLVGTLKIPNHIELVGRSTSKWDIIASGPSVKSFVYSTTT